MILIVSYNCLWSGRLSDQLKVLLTWLVQKEPFHDRQTLIRLCSTKQSNRRCSDALCQFERRDVKYKEDRRHCKAKLKKAEEKLAKDAARLQARWPGLGSIQSHQTLSPTIALTLTTWVARSLTRGSSKRWQSVSSAPVPWCCA